MQHKNRFIAQEESDFSSHLPKRAKQQLQLKIILKNCYQLISDLQQNNIELKDKLTQKQSIVLHLIEEKQRLMISIQLLKKSKSQVKLTEENRKIKQICYKYQNLIKQYQKSMEKDKHQIIKLRQTNKNLLSQNQKMKINTQKYLTTLESRKKSVGKISNVSSSNKKIKLRDYINTYHDNLSNIGDGDKQKIFNPQNYQLTQNSLLISPFTYKTSRSTQLSNSLKKPQNEIYQSKSIFLDTKNPNVIKNIFREVLTEIKDENNSKISKILESDKKNKMELRQFEASYLKIEKDFKKISKMLEQSDQQS